MAQQKKLRSPEKAKHEWLPSYSRRNNDAVVAQIVNRCKRKRKADRYTHLHAQRIDGNDEGGDLGGEV